MKMRATSERDLKAKALPWLNYFSTPHPYEDFHGVPRLLFVLESEKTEARFHDIVRERCDEFGIRLPLFTSTRGTRRRVAALLTDGIWYALGRTEAARCGLS